MIRPAKILPINFRRQLTILQTNCIFACTKNILTRLNLPLYSDSLLDITEDSLVIKNFYFFNLSKVISFADIVTVHVYEPSLMTGKYRLWGTGAFQAWFAMDGKRPWRDKIFVADTGEKWLRTGFTVESSDAVISILNNLRIPLGFD